MKVRVVKQTYLTFVKYVPQHFNLFAGWKNILPYPCNDVDNLEEAKTICKNYKEKNSTYEDEVVWEED